jgi:hypothetical protein
LSTFFWCERWDSNPQNSVFETDTYTYSVTLAQYCLIRPMITSVTAPIINALYVITPVLLNSISTIHMKPTHVTQKHPLSNHSFIIYPQRLVGVLGFEPSQEHSSSAKGIIRPSRVPTPTPLFLYVSFCFMTTFRTMQLAVPVIPQRGFFIVTFFTRLTAFAVHVNVCHHQLRIWCARSDSN